MLPRKQQGAILILALFIMSLVAMISVTMMASLSRDIHRTELFLNHIQAELKHEKNSHYPTS